MPVRTGKLSFFFKRSSKIAAREKLQLQQPIVPLKEKCKERQKRKYGKKERERGRRVYANYWELHF
jgi:hypothetical protein